MNKSLSCSNSNSTSLIPMPPGNVVPMKTPMVYSDNIFPRNHDLQQVSHKDIEHAMSRLNFRPRKSLRFKTPFEVFYHSSVALTS